MSHAAADRNLLFGILAVQMDFVSADQLVTAMNAWILDKAKPLGGHLVEARALAADTHSLLQALVDKHVAQHGGSVERSLATLGSGEQLRDGLAKIADADVQTTLARVGAATLPGDRHATMALPRPLDLPAGQRFCVLRPHASGGLGKVSVARDAELNREVALKELHDRHADNADSRARFLQEAEITGGLEHPGIVPIYGLGQYADGRPFYAMRFIRGESLAQAIDRFHRDAVDDWSNPADVLQFRRLLNRLTDVCNAVDYAHSRGVLHRDLKPDNIMLGQYGETLVVDWGLAKPRGQAGVDAHPTPASATIPPSYEGALTPLSGSGSAPTLMGSAIGTPAYMSPEQAAGRLDQLGPASDVYSLGATLYVLLSGRSPQEDDDLGIVIQRVQRGEFPPPRSIKPAAPRGLEAICLKAMALRPEDRYSSARKLADDIDAWLADEPVTALPEGWPTRAGRWVKNHRTLVSSAAAVLLVSVVSLSVGNLRLSAANDRERDAKDAALQAKDAAQAAQAEAERQGARNEELLALASKSLERYEALSESELLNRYGMESLRSALQEGSLEFYETLARQQGESESARYSRAQGLFRLASTYWQLGRMDQSRDAFEKSQTVFKGLVQDFPENRDYRRGVASVYSALGEMLTNAYAPAAAAEPLAEARGRLQELHRASPGDFGVATRLAWAESLEGERLRQLGKSEEAAAAMERGIAILRGFDLKSAPVDESRNIRYRLGRALNQLGTHQTYALWKLDAARKSLDEAQAVMQLLDEELPNAEYGFSLAQIRRNSGYLYARELYMKEAREMYGKAIEALAAVEQRHPDVPHYRQEMAELLHANGSLRHPLESGGVSPELLAQLEQAAAIGAQLVERFPQQMDRRLSLARYQTDLGGFYQLAGRIDDAGKVYDAAVAQLAEVSRHAGDNAENVDTLDTLGEIHYTVADQLEDIGRVDDALPILDVAEANFDRLVKLSPRNGEAYLRLGDVYITRSNCFEKQGRLVDAVTELDRVAEASFKARDLAEMPWMKAGMQTVATLAKTLKWGHLSRVRDNGLRPLADQGKFDLLRDQALRFPQLTKEPQDHFAAAHTLAYAARVAAAAEGLAVDERNRTSESLAAEAVKQLSSAWESGYLRRSGGFSAIFSSAPTLKTIREDENFAVLRDREDLATLVRRIESDEPPRVEPADADLEAPSAAPKKTPSP